MWIVRFILFIFKNLVFFVQCYVSHVHCALHIVHCAVFSVKCKVGSVHYSFCNMQCAVCSVRCADALKLAVTAQLKSSITMDFTFADPDLFASVQKLSKNKGANISTSKSWATNKFLRFSQTVVIVGSDAISLLFLQPKLTSSCSTTAWPGAGQPWNDQMSSLKVASFLDG